MLNPSYHRIFLENSATDKHEIFLYKVSINFNIQKKCFSVAQYWRKMQCKLAKFQSCLLRQLCKFEILQVTSHFSRKLCEG